VTEQRVARIASLLAEAYHTADELDQFGSPGYRKRGKALWISAQLFADCLPASIGVGVANEVREWSGEIEGDGSRALAIRSLLRRLDPSGSPKIL
jgi:hypothetical protein